MDIFERDVFLAIALPTITYLGDLNELKDFMDLAHCKVQAFIKQYKATSLSDRQKVLDLVTKLYIPQALVRRAWSPRSHWLLRDSSTAHIYQSPLSVLQIWHGG